MSHADTVEIHLKDLTMVAEALKEMGFQIKEGKHTIADWAKRSFEVDLSASKDGKQLCLGWRQKADGSLEMVKDWYGIGMNQKDFMAQLSTLYSKNTATQWLKGKGYSVAYENDEQGNLIVVGSKW